jgi:proton-dependent oligopeptide transporter, POT family
MFKGHPKGLIIASIANMGERFGFYTMMAILVLFLQTRYGLDEKTAGDIYSWFYFGIYALALVGGITADLTKKYKLVILAGIALMLGGYILLFIPGMTLTFTVIGLFIIAFGNGLFKGNLQAVVGQMYDNPIYAKLRDRAFMIFYMCINVGAFFAPFAATGIRNWWLETNGFYHDGSLPALCHQALKGSLHNVDAFLKIASNASMHGPVTDAKLFASQYLDVFSQGYNYAFGIAAASMLLSFVVYLAFYKLLPNKDKIVQVEHIAESKSVQSEKAKDKSTGNPISIIISLALMAATAVLCQVLFNDYKLGLAFGLYVAFVSWIMQISNKEERPRINALVLVFTVVIFFWMSFHQNGLTLTFFARDYITKTVDSFTYLFFTLPSILAVIATISGAVMLMNKQLSKNIKVLAIIMTVGGAGLSYYFINGNSTLNAISPEVFQSFNPLFIVALTPIVMGLFTMLSKKDMEPSTPKKIGYGMVIAAIGFFIVLVASMGLISPIAVKAGGLTDYARVSPYWLISSYLIMTVAELFLSPMGLSFASKVAPPRFQGLMQSGWLLATAVGNKLLVVGSIGWGKLELWQLWAVFIVCCLLSAGFIFSIMKRLEKVAK